MCVITKVHAVRSRNRMQLEILPESSMKRAQSWAVARKLA